MEVSNFEMINALKQKIVGVLQPLINSNYVLLDVPNHKNIGDNLIWQGELDFLEKYIPYLKVYSSNHYTFNSSKVPDGATILLHGGGNFGDIYPEAQEFRAQIIKKFQTHRIIVLPQTVFYKDKQLLKKDADIFNAHGDLHICVRDTVSFDLLSSVVKPEKLLLLPDMAFFMDLSKHISDLSTGRVLIMQRTDKEFNSSYDLSWIKGHVGGVVDIKDWPTYNYKGVLSRLVIYAEIAEKKLSENFSNVPVLNRFINPEFGLKSSKNRRRYIATGIHFMNHYDKIVTTRLHGLILAILLNKKVLLLDNSYGKITSFYNTWLKDFKNIEVLQ